MFRRDVEYDSGSFLIEGLICLRDGMVGNRAAYSRKPKKGGGGAIRGHSQGTQSTDIHRNHDHGILESDVVRLPT